MWTSDFTYLKFQGYFIYLVTLIDVYSREIVGWNISNCHDTDLILDALKHAIKRTGKTPIYLHFKVDLGYISRFETVEELIEAIYQTIYYYNNQRIHTSIKMAPVSFRYIYEERLLRQTV